MDFNRLTNVELSKTMLIIVITTIQYYCNKFTITIITLRMESHSMYSENVY